MRNYSFFVNCVQKPRKIQEKDVQSRRAGLKWLKHLHMGRTCPSDQKGSKQRARMAKLVGMVFSIKCPKCHMHQKNLANGYNDHDHHPGSSYGIGFFERVTISQAVAYSDPDSLVYFPIALIRQEKQTYRTGRLGSFSFWKFSIF